MPFEITHNTIEHWDKQMPAQYWARNKKASLNLNNDVPLAMDRQFSDQWELIEKNKNPRLYEPMKCDRPITEVRFAKKGVPTPLGMKAKVLNKVVRDASEVKDYVITAPIRTKEEIEALKDEPFDPDVHPLMKPYRKEANQKPKMMNFGHRPSSANRTFHPATMKVKLEHGEIARNKDASNSSFGLPVVVLSKVLNAPKLYHNSDIEGRLGSSEKPSRENTSVDPNSDPLGLFSMPEANSTVTSTVASSPDGKGILNTESWVSNADDNEINFSKSMTTNNAKFFNKSNSTKSRWKEGKDWSKLRGPWDTAHHMIKESPNDRFLLKRSALLEAKRPIKERLTRFIAKAASTGPIDDEPLGMEKVLVDRLIAKGGKPYIYQRSKAENPYFDEYVEYAMNDINHAAKAEVDKRTMRVKEFEYKKALDTIPNVPYYPDTVMSDIAGGDTQLIDNVAKRSEKQKFKNSLDTGFKVASLAERTEKYFEKKRKEAGTGLTGKPKSEFDPGLAFTDAGFSASDVYGLSAGLPPLQMQKDNHVSPFLLESEYTKKKKAKKKIDPAEAKMREAIRRAAKGDQDALFDHFIGAEVLQGIRNETKEEMMPEPEIPIEFIKAQKALDNGAKPPPIVSTNNEENSKEDIKNEDIINTNNDNKVITDEIEVSMIEAVTIDNNI